MNSQEMANHLFKKLTEGINQYGEYCYLMGSRRVVNMTTLSSELRQMPAEDAGAALSLLGDMENAQILVTDLVEDLADWDEFYDHPSNERLIARFT